MKAVSKKKFPKKEDARKHLEEKFGKTMVEHKYHKTRWMFMPGEEKEPLELKPWNDFVKDYAEANDLTYAEALKAASPVYKALKEAEQKAA